MCTIAIDYLIFGVSEISLYMWMPYLHLLKMYIKQHSDTNGQIQEKMLKYDKVKAKKKKSI
jgi:hypothetical protein